LLIEFSESSREIVRSHIGLLGYKRAVNRIIVDCLESIRKSRTYRQVSCENL